MLYADNTIYTPALHSGMVYHDMRGHSLVENLYFCEHRLSLNVITVVMYKVVHVCQLCLTQGIVLYCTILYHSRFCLNNYIVAGTSSPHR